MEARVSQRDAVRRQRIERQNRLHCHGTGALAFNETSISSAPIIDLMSSKTLRIASAASSSCPRSPLLRSSSTSALTSGARNRALVELVLECPLSLVADALGYSHQVTFRHANKAAEPCGYVDPPALSWHRSATATWPSPMPRSAPYHHQAPSNIYARCSYQQGGEAGRPGYIRRVAAHG